MDEARGRGSGSGWLAPGRGLWRGARGVLGRVLLRWLNRRIRKGVNGMVFLCGHMRSGSSLLVHILNSHPGVMGYGETHTRYGGRADYGRAAWKICRSFRSYPRRGTWLLDKVLHNHLMADPDLLAGGRTLFLIRRPGPALTSIYRQGVHFLETPAQVAEYYFRRLDWIARAASSLNRERWTWATYEELVERPEELFRRLEVLLELEGELSGEYEVIWSTGRRGIGDNSDEIFAGRIVRKDLGTVDEDTVSYREMAPFMDEARGRFEECLEVLRGRETM